MLDQCQTLLPDEAFASAQRLYPVHVLVKALQAANDRNVTKTEIREKKVKTDLCAQWKSQSSASGMVVSGAQTRWSVPDHLLLLLPSPLLCLCVWLATVTSR